MSGIGGQAVLEGIMMKSTEKTALAVRLPDKSIDISYLNGESIRQKYKILAIPIVRGVVGFVESMVQGYKALSISAQKSGFADEENEKEKTEEDKKKESRLMSVIMAIGGVLGVLLAVVLFTAFVPSTLAGGAYLEDIIETKNLVVPGSPCLPARPRN